MHHGGEPLGVRGRDDRGDRLSVERGDLVTPEAQRIAQPRSCASCCDTRTR